MSSAAVFLRSTHRALPKRVVVRFPIVIPAKAGIHLIFSGRNMDPRFRGDDAGLLWKLSPI
jgi:hypothetical protein